MKNINLNIAKVMTNAAPEKVSIQLPESIVFTSTSGDADFAQHSFEYLKDGGTRYGA